MSLKNFSKIKLSKNSQSYWKLYKINGEEIVPFTEWTIFLQNRFSYQTRDKYSQVVSKFLDYLVEVDIFENIVTKLEFKNSIEDYKQLLAYGKEISNPKLKRVSEELNFNSIAPASWSNNIAAINSFLRFVFEKEEDEREYLSVKENINLSPDFQKLLPELNRNIKLNHYQKEALKQKSFLANLYRKNGDIHISGGIKSKYTKIIKNQNEDMDFPAIEVPNLLRNTSCHRDRAIYALLAGTGIRSSEALSLTWNKVDITNQQIYIENQDELNENIRFKGRETNKTFFIPELRHVFFDALYNYQLKEASPNSNHDYVFQFLKGKLKGTPYFLVSRQSFIKSFKKTAKRTGNQSPLLLEKEWTPHSLRHFYGVYMLNHIPTLNGYGFSIEEVQKMMGHKSIEVTKQYARKEVEYIKSQLEYAETFLDNKNLTNKEFNKIFLNKYKKDLFND
jgi:integrase